MNQEWALATATGSTTLVAVYGTRIGEAVTLGVGLFVSYKLYFIKHSL